MNRSRFSGRHPARRRRRRPAATAAAGHSLLSRAAAPTGAHGSAGRADQRPLLAVAGRRGQGRSHRDRVRHRGAAFRRRPQDRMGPLCQAEGRQARRHDGHQAGQCVDREGPHRECRARQRRRLGVDRRRGRAHRAGRGADPRRGRFPRRQGREGHALQGGRACSTSSGPASRRCGASPRATIPATACARISTWSSKSRSRRSPSRLSPSAADRWTAAYQARSSLMSGPGGLRSASCRSRRAPIVGAFVLGMAGMALHPVPVDLVRRARGVEALPQVDVLHRLLVGRAPAVASSSHGSTW